MKTLLLTLTLLLIGNTLRADRGADALAVAACAGDAEAVLKALDTSRQNLNTQRRLPDTEGSALFHAAACRDIGHRQEDRIVIVRALVEAGSDIHNLGSIQFTDLTVAMPPHLAAALMARAPILEYFLQNGADVFETDRVLLGNAVLWAAEGGCHECIPVLARFGAKVNAANAAGVSALHIAALHGNLRVTEALLANGANAFAKDPSGITALEVAANESVHAAIERAQLASYVRLGVLAITVLALAGIGFFLWSRREEARG
jgi:ankyrin repeat protein